MQNSSKEFQSCSSVRVFEQYNFTDTCRRVAVNAFYAFVISFYYGSSKL